ncbi:MAG: hypothetical protein JOZ23_12940 [Mycobacterium sp.]|nr:hypothetical protein [Mycobacterium sp.]
MTDNQNATDRVIQAYYSILKGGMASFDEQRLREILAPELDFHGPIAGHRIGAEPFIKGVRGLAATMHGLTMVQQLCTDDAAAALYDAEMPGGTVRFAEFFQVNDRRIESLKLLFDRAEYTARGGR